MLRLFLFSLLFIATLSLEAADRRAAGNEMLARYFETETSLLEAKCLTGLRSKSDWDATARRAELFEMLSLDPLPEKTDLKPVVTGVVERETFKVEKVHFQSMPNLYVTGNLYIPKGLKKPAPTILYVCGHGPVIKDGVSYGNKVHYQHHGAWFARNGYVCLTIDTVQMGEIQGIHHGTYREGMWWWNARGYTSAGAEAWNVIRSLDYLETRPEVDARRFGITGRSGGGAYSWWGAALDERIKVAAPVAGITDLRNHVVDGVVEGHCDCMFTVNTYRWDYAQVAALVAPRPLLILNTDNDRIFPLDGVVRLHKKVKSIYDLHNAGQNLGLLIAPGPHKDTQDLQVPAFRWFNRHLKGEDPLIEMAAEKFFEPEELKVFKELPEDERTSDIYESFLAPFEFAPVPVNARGWSVVRDGWMAQLKDKVFAGWPGDRGNVAPRRIRTQRNEMFSFDTFEFQSQSEVTLMFSVLSKRSGGNEEQVTMEVLDDGRWVEWQQHIASAFGESSKEVERNAANGSLAKKLTQAGGVLVLMSPRGVGMTAWDSSNRKQVQNRRRFMLLGQTLDGMRVWDIAQGVRSVRKLDFSNGKRLTLAGVGASGCNALYASLFLDGNVQLELTALPDSHRKGPDYLNILRFLDVPQCLAMVTEKNDVTLLKSGDSDWSYPLDVKQSLGWGDRLRLR